MPSRWSGVPIVARTARRSSAMLSWSGLSPAPTMHLSIPATAIVGMSASSRASAWACSNSSSFGQTSLTSPIPQRLGARDLLRAKDHVEGVIASDAAREARAPAPCGDRPEIQLGKSHLAAFRRREAEVTGERQLETSAEAVPTQHGDDRLREVLDRVEDVEALVEEGLETSHALQALGELLQVHSDREVVGPRTANDDGTHAGVARDACDLHLQRVHEVEAHAVPRTIVDHQGLDRAISFDEQRNLGRVAVG